MSEMSELISGKEARLAWANGQDVEFRILDSVNHKNWKNIYNASYGFNIHDFDSDEIEFRLKPETVKITIEVPKCGTSYKLNTYMYVLNSLEPEEYAKVILDESDEIPAYWWRTEEEVKQVIAELRKLKG